MSEPYQETELAISVTYDHNLEKSIVAIGTYINKSLISDARIYPIRSTNRALLLGFSEMVLAQPIFKGMIFRIVTESTYLPYCTSNMMAWHKSKWKTKSGNIVKNHDVLHFILSLTRISPKFIFEVTDESRLLDVCNKKIKSVLQSKRITQQYINQSLRRSYGTPDIFQSYFLS